MAWAGGEQSLYACTKISKDLIALSHSGVVAFSYEGLLRNALQLVAERHDQPEEALQLGGGHQERDPG